MNTDGGMQRIVVGVDGSDGSIAALRRAERIATATGARVEAIACWSVPAALALPYALGTVDFEDGAQKLLDETIRKAFGEPTPENVSTRLVQGLPRQTLVEAADGAEMLVVGRRGRGGFRGLLLGSVSQACVSHAQCPVLVMNPLGSEEASSGEGDGGPGLV
ncbi:universal stress protein [Arthrobacter sp.]|uniref:universal stress protein n=1 Tax=Arthrobacter sp. TaxID=1667 RepID=UPI0026E026B1|nr:universal stress protein [Arthrobacter sp.]MDO5752901.1 universal stress protein [Arthrobacter sp.]